MLPTTWSIFIFLAIYLPVVYSQDDLSGPIQCYFCYGQDGNSSCADPIDEKNHNLHSEECIHGVCIKWTRYIKGVLMIERTCSARMTLNIMMTDGVCRTESDGNGYLCMCGKHLCNHGNSLKRTSSIHVILLTFCVFSSLYKWSPWFR